MESVSPGISVISVPFNSAGTPDGVARGPAALRGAGVLPGARFVEAHVPPADPVRGPSGVLAEEALAAMVESVAGHVLEAWAADHVPVVLGGDCPVLLGGLVAAERRGYGAGLVFVDGHEDAWDPHRSPTGEAADSEIALALGLVEPPAALARVLPCLRAEDLVQLGPRDADELARAGHPSVADRVTTVGGHRLATPDGRAEASRAAGTLVARTGHWWLHVDLDVLSTGALHAVDYPQPGGLSFEDLEELTAALLAIGGCGGLSVAIYNPDIDAGEAAPRIAGYVTRAAGLL